ncbi:hypothetical protein DWG18_09000 [Lysobacter sp. TY2-98]|uniref:hypothetical protein n=1 Tax=Lysobacter sp. TY2-98 TaxID=2290922 RepID=UPI000E20A56C|nr:hypothetical protein [Lysobacter sp. TY2-98]AXK72397.1 hypothetical protein DWG18_09000 [Lysobacter sp. TY2-98]
MELAIFASASGGVVLVPTPFRPPDDAITLHGPLVPRGFLRVIDAEAAPWPELVLQLERHLFAALGAAEAGVLLGSSAARTTL